MKGRNQGERLREKHRKNVAKVLVRIPDPDVDPSDPNAGGVGLSSWMLNVVALVVGVVFAYLVSTRFIVGPTTPSPSPSPSPTPTPPPPTPTPTPTPDPTPEQSRIHNAMVAVGIVLIFFLAYILTIKLFSIARNMTLAAAGMGKAVAYATARGTYNLGARLLRWIFIPQVLVSLLFIAFMVLAFLNWDTRFFTDNGFFFGDIFLMNTVLFLMYGVMLLSIWPMLGFSIFPTIVFILFLYNGLLTGILSNYGINAAFAISTMAVFTTILGLFAVRYALPPPLAGFACTGILSIAALLTVQLGFNAFAQQEKTGLPAIPGLEPDTPELPPP
nr:hypothetical protein [Sicyoidochytrium minutum DNA virus]